MQATFTVSGTYRATRKTLTDAPFSQEGPQLWDYDEDTGTCILSSTEGSGDPVPAAEFLTGVELIEAV